MTEKIIWPEGKQFAFTIFDDTDNSTCENTRRVYALLKELGLRTTKSVWPLAPTETPLQGGSTCADPEYLQWVKHLQSKGFEIALHNATSHSSPRQDTLKGLEHFRELFGHDPKTFANHSDCRENIYWGSARLTAMYRALYNLLTLYRNRNYTGHIEGDPLFWADLCSERVSYVRNFVLSDINTLGFCPFMPYFDPDRPYVKAWFASSEGGTVESFLKTLNEDNQQRLLSEGGACIMYTHFGKGFYSDGALNSEFKKTMESLASKNGWFVPVGELLDYLIKQRGLHTITPGERSGLERKWLLHKIRTGAS